MLFGGHVVGVLAFATWASCAAINQTMSGNTLRRCIDRGTWIPPDENLDANDCVQALEAFKHDYVRRAMPKLQYEFDAPRARGFSPLQRQETPQKSSYGSCSVAVVMLSTFQARDLPSLPPGPLLPQGVATYDEILTALNEVLRYCVASRSIPGYGSVGNIISNIGVFFFGADSDMDDRVEDQRAESSSLGSDGSALIGNGTFTQVATLETE